MKSRGIRPGNGLTTRLPYELIIVRERPRSCEWFRRFEALLLTIIGSPFAGRKVTRRTGHTACPGLN